MGLPIAHRVTTAHLQAAYPFMSEGGLGGRGVYIGHDLFGGAFAYDPWELYASGVLTNPNTLIAGVVGKGKALAVDTPVPTPSGWTTMGELQVGQQVFDEQGRAADVLAATEVMTRRPCYRVTFSDGQHIVADADHLWVTWDHPARNAQVRARLRARDGHVRLATQAGPRLRTTEEMRRSLWVIKPTAAQRNHAIPLCSELSYPKADLPVDPYVLGAWLGDGGHDRGLITCHPQDVWIVDRIRQAGYEVREEKAGFAWSVLGLTVQLGDMGVLGNTHVPDGYLHAAPDQRRALLCGLMDTDGHVAQSGQCEFASMDRRLAEAVAELAIGLGMKAVMTSGRALLNGRDCGTEYRVRFHTAQVVFSLPRKQARMDAWAGGGQETRDSFRYVTDVDPVPTVPVRCIQVDAPRGLFLAGRGCVPTHNSALVKSYLIRQQVFGRRAVVLSPKPGEYDRLAEAMGARPISLFPGGTVRLNPLDPMIAAAEASSTAIAQHRETLLVSLAEASVRRPLEPEEVSACGLALAEAKPDRDGILTLPAVVDALLRPTREAAESIAVDVETLARDGRKAGLALRRLVTGDLRGMFDAPTTPGVSLGGPLTVIDLSRMYNSPALGIIMLCANAWQQAAVSRSDGGKWIVVSEEAWATLRYTSVARAMQESYKLARSYGVQNIIVLHRLSDLEATGAAGSETRTLAQGLLEDAETRIILNQPPGEIATAVRLLGLTEAEAALLPTLPRARALWKISDRSFLVDHRLSRDEWPIIDTDARMNVESRAVAGDAAARGN